MSRMWPGRAGGCGASGPVRLRRRRRRTGEAEGGRGAGASIRAAQNCHNALRAPRKSSLTWKSVKPISVPIQERIESGPAPVVVAWREQWRRLPVTWELPVNPDGRRTCPPESAATKSRQARAARRWSVPSGSGCGRDVERLTGAAATDDGQPWADGDARRLGRGAADRWIGSRRELPWLRRSTGSPPSPTARGPEVCGGQPSPSLPWRRSERCFGGSPTRSLGRRRRMTWTVLLSTPCPTSSTMTSSWVFLLPPNCLASPAGPSTRSSMRAIWRPRSRDRAVTRADGPSASIPPPSPTFLSGPESAPASCVTFTRRPPGAATDQARSL